MIKLLKNGLNDLWKKFLYKLDEPSLEEWFRYFEEGILLTYNKETGETETELIEGDTLETDLFWDAYKLGVTIDQLESIKYCTEPAYSQRLKEFKEQNLK